MTLTLTGKTSGYTLTLDSYYAPYQLWSKRVSDLGLVEDLRRVMEALNRVESWLGISETTWSTTMGGAPSNVNGIHYAVRIGGDANNLGTLREAIDRLRSEGGVDPWTWYFAPTSDDLWNNFHVHRNCLSSIAILEYFIAIGRVVGTGNVGEVGWIDWSVHHHPFKNPKTGAAEEFYEVGVGGLGGHPGTFSGMDVYTFGNYWETFGYFSKTQSERRGSGVAWDESIDIDEGSEFDYPAGLNFDPTFNPDEDRYPRNDCQAAVYGRVFVIKDYEDIEREDAIEAFENAYSDLWDYVFKEDQTDSGDELEIGTIQQTEDISSIVSIECHKGAASYLSEITPTYQRETYAGEYGTTVHYDGAGAPVQYDEGGLNFTEQWMTPNRQFGPYFFDAGWSIPDVNINSPMWQHNAANRPLVPNTVWPSGTPEYFHFRTFDDATYEEATTLPQGNWRNSNDNPFESVGYPYRSSDAVGDASDESTANTVLGNLSGEAGSPIFTPGEETPRKYFWVWVEAHVRQPDLASTLRPQLGAEYDGILTDVSLPWGQWKNFNGWTTKTRLNPYEFGWDQHLRGSIYGGGYIRAVRRANMTFPTNGQATGKWIVWNSAGTNGHSPFEECVTRFTGDGF